MWWIVAALAVLAGLFFTRPVFGVTLETSYPLSLDEIFQKWGTRYGVDWKLLKAVAMRESNLNPLSVNAADNESLGIMQILCRPNGTGGCMNALNVDGWNTITRAALLDADTNVKIGSQILAYNIRQYGLPKAIAVYNRWSERNSPQEGPFANQVYVDRVFFVYRSLM